MGLGSEASDLALSSQVASLFLMGDTGYDGTQDAEPPSLKPEPREKVSNQLFETMSRKELYTELLAHGTQWKQINITTTKCGLPWWLSGKNPPKNIGDMGSIPGLGRSPGVGNGNPLQYSCLGNPTDRGAWRASVHGVTKELDTT